MSEEIQAFSKFITNAWKGTGVKLTISQINNTAEAPNEETIKKTHLYIGVVRGKEHDTVIVLKHSLAVCYTLAGHIEDMSDTMLHMCGILPQKNNPLMKCHWCHRTDTYFDTNEYCIDCKKGILKNTGTYQFGILTSGNRNR